jgi:hypothetical protein
MPEFLLVKGYDNPSHAINGRMWHARGLNLIFANQNELALSSHFSKDKVVTETSDSYILFKGHVDDLYFLGGIEEADHARHDQMHKNAALPLDADKVSSPVYAAQDHEFEALLIQFKAAIALGLPAITIRVLEKRIEDAHRIRQLFNK